MNRREAIKRTTFLLGYAVSASAVAGVLSGCQPDTKMPVENWKPQTFSDLQINTLREVAERIVPRTEGIVGAKDVMVERYVDKLYSGFFKPNQVEAFKKGLDQLEADAQANYNNPFAKLEPAQMDEMISKIAQETTTFQKQDDKIGPFFFSLKEAVLLGFFNSEEVGEKVLNYDPVPTEFNGCLPMSEVPNGRSWSL